MEQTKEMLAFMIGLGMAFDKAIEDKKFELSDLGLFVSPMLLAEKAFNGLSEVKNELKNLDQAKKQELADWVKKEFDIKNDKLENQIESVIQLGVDVFSFIENFKGE